MSVAYLVFIVILIVQIDIHFPQGKECIQKLFAKKKNEKGPEPLDIPQETYPNNDGATYSEVIVSPKFASPDATRVLDDLKYTRYRESLLSDSEDHEPRGFIDTIRSTLDSQLESTV